MNPIKLPGLVTMGTREAWDLRSLDNVYRYAIGRCWDPALVEGEWNVSRPVFSVIAHNPSKARFDVNDPTLLKLVHFAKQEGCGSLLLRNLGAYSATDPDDFYNAVDPIGPRNDEVLEIDPMFAVRVLAWGNFPSAKKRQRLLGSIDLAKRNNTNHVFGFNKSGEPKHPLYLKNSTRVCLSAERFNSTALKKSGS